MIEIYFDGLCEPNPGGVATYGYVIFQDGKQIKTGNNVIGKGKGMTNNVAEYSALLRAFEWIDKQDISEKITVKGDSRLVIKQMKDDWKIKSDTSKKFVPEIRNLLRGRTVEFIWIPREENKEADKLARVAYERYLKERSKI